MQETWESWARSLSGEDPLEEGMATHSSIVFLPEESPRPEETGGLQSTGLQRVWHDWSDLACTHVTPPLLCNHHPCAPFVAPGPCRASVWAHGFAMAPEAASLRASCTWAPVSWPKSPLPGLCAWRSLVRFPPPGPHPFTVFWPPLNYCPIRETLMPNA